MGQPYEADHLDFRNDARFVVPILVVLAFLLGLIHSGSYPTEDNAAKLVDLLIISITISGITVPVSIGYLSLGRALDVFSEIGDTVPFWMSQHGLTEGTLLTARLNAATEKTDIAKELGLDLAAVHTLCLLQRASARHLSHTLKLRLVPEGLRKDYCKFFSNHTDQWVVQFNARVVGALGVVCTILVFLTHYGFRGEWLSWFTHMAVVFTLMMNGYAYLFLYLLSRVRLKLQQGIGPEITNLCVSAKRYQERLVLEGAGRANEATLSLAATVQELAAKTAQS